MSSSSEFKLGSLEKHQLVFGEELNKLVRKLADFPGIHGVKAIAPNLQKPHIVKFELQLITNSELSEQIWREIQNLVIDSEWQLRDRTQESWYFDVEISQKSFNKYLTQPQILADSNNL